MFGGGRGGGGGRQVCQFFLQGRCKFGDSCKNEHPQNQSNNRFAPLQNQNGGRSRAGQSSQNDNPYGITADNIKTDLTDDRPIWPFSSYGPGKLAPVQLIEGELEQSPEEMRVMYYLAVAGGNAQEAAVQEAQASAKSNEAVQRILNDLDGAVKYCIDGKDKHPNRLDQEIKGNNAQSAPSSSPFGAAPAASASPFGQPSNPGQQSSPFGKPATSAFGQPSAFGQSSALGKPAASPFGQPSSLGGGAPSAFGQPSGMGQNSGFGQPTQMGQKSAFGQPAFGQTSKPAFGQPAQTNAFGGGSPFGQPQQNQNKANPFASSGNQASGFAQAAQQPSSGFGQPSTFGAAAKAASPFGQPSQNPAQSNPFGANNQTQPKPNPFGAPSQSSAFGQPTQPTQSPFGAPAPAANPAFGQPTQPNNTNLGFGAPPQPSAFLNPQQPKQSPFGRPSQPGQQSNPFGAGAAANNNNTANPFATQQPAQTQANGPTAPHAGPDPSTYLTLNAQRQPTSFKQRPVRFDSTKKQFYYSSPSNPAQEERLWFPEGPPAKANADSELDEGFYTGDLGKALEEVYKGVIESGTFAGGVMPEVPPKGAWVGFDL